MRYNIFYRIHKGLRAYLYETGLALQRTDFTNEEEALSILQSINKIVELFESHAYHEDNYIFTAIEQYEPSVADAFEKEHVKDHELGEKLSALLASYNTLKTDAEKIQYGSDIRTTFVDFMAFNLVHMAKEEDIINNLLWRYYSDEEILAIEHKIVSNQNPEDAATVLKWMIRGLSNVEIINWMKAVEKNAPEEIFNKLFITAENELNEDRFRIIIEGLTEGQMVA
jgi:hemerythrin-like domain-containing protein